MNTTRNMLVDADTNEEIRPATREEFDASIAAVGGTGIILDDDGRRVYVDGEIWIENVTVEGAAVTAECEDKEFEALVNAELARRYPGVEFTEKEDLNRLVAGNNVADVTDQIDYDSILESDPRDLADR